MSWKGDRDKTKAAMWFSFAWVAFTFLSPLYIIFQIKQLDDEFEDAGEAWRIFGFSVCVIMPICAIFLNWLKWKLHYNWVVNRGREAPDEQLPPEAKEKVFTPLREEDTELGTCMSVACGAIDMDIDERETQTPYSSMIE